MQGARYRRGPVCRSHGESSVAHRWGGLRRSPVISHGVVSPLPTPPQRQVFHTDALVWLAERAPLVGCSVVTSLPDHSELPKLDFAGWQDWFARAAGAVVAAVPPDGIAIFFQSDVLHRGSWVDKAALIDTAASTAGAELLFHKIVCRKPAGSLSFGRASYGHMLGFGRGLHLRQRRGRMDVLPDGGFRPGTKSMGVLACRDACQTILDETPTRTIVDPFCGFGTVLAVANVLGLDSIGVDLSARMCRKSRGLVITPAEVEADGKG
jgi:hypothetical protein